MPTNFNFRLPQQRSVLADRRAALQNLTQSRRLDIQAGKNELDALDAIAASEQAEYKIRKELEARRQVSSALREIGKIDPIKDQDYFEKYARIMADHPYAQNDQFLKENFIQMGRVHQRAMEGDYLKKEEEQKQKGRLELEGVKSMDRQYEWLQKQAAKAATMVCLVSISGSSPACYVISGRSHRNDSIPAGHGCGVIEGGLCS